MKDDFFLDYLIDGNWVMFIVEPGYAITTRAYVSGRN